MSMVLAKLFISVVVCVIGILGLRFHSKLRNTHIVAYYGVRLGLMAVLVFMLKKIPPDVVGYFELAQRVLLGEVPNRDFTSPYGFLYNYLVTTSCCIYKHEFSIITLFIILECCGLLLIRKSLHKIIGDAGLVNKAIILYLFSPIILQTLWLGAQDEALQVMLVGVLLYLYAQKKENSVTVLSVIGMGVTKIFSAWLVAPFLMAYRTSKWFLFLFLITLYYGVLALFKVKPFSTTFEFSSNQAGHTLADILTSGNIWWLVQKILGTVPEHIPEGLILVLFGMIFIFCLSGCKSSPSQKANIVLPDAVFAGLILFPLFFNIFYKMTFIVYLAYAIPFINIFMLRDTPKLAYKVYFVWAILYSVDSTFCWRILGSPMSNSLSVLTFAYEFLLVMLSLYLIAVVVRHYMRDGYSLKKGFLQIKERVFKLNESF